MKVVLPPRIKSGVSHSRSCGADSCAATTREGKPYCPDHVGMNPHSQRVLADIQRRADEDDQVRRGLTETSDINIHGITAQEILQSLIDHGPRTKQRLCREINLEPTVIDGYIAALLEQRVITVGRTSRGSTVVALPK